MTKHKISLKNILYENNSKIVTKIKNCIINEYDDLFLAVLVHGSVGSNEIIKYSDFDGILIIKNKYKNSKLLKRFINESMKIILQFDPFQHHGWFIIYEDELESFSENKLPIQVVKNSKVIFYENKLSTLTFRIRRINYEYNFIIIHRSIMSYIKNKQKLNNLYKLKAFLSQVMLLPSIYYFTVNKRGILKSDSFKFIYKEFSEFDNLCFKVSTKIRQDWDYNLNWFQYFVMTQNNKYFRYLTKKIISPNVPKKYYSLINQNFYASLISCLNRMHLNIFKNQ